MGFESPPQSFMHGGSGIGPKGHCGEGDGLTCVVRADMGADDWASSSLVVASVRGNRDKDTVPETALQSMPRGRGTRRP